MRHSYFLSMLILFAMLFGVSQAELPVAHNSEKTIAASRWDVLDIRFTTDSLPGHPLDLAFTANFTSSSGLTFELPGIHNAGDDFLIRFTPPETKKWTYATHSSHKPLNKRTGKLDVASEERLRRGGVIIDPKSAQRFIYGNGDRYYPIAFESDWLFALDATNQSAIPHTQMFVDTLAAWGFNQLVMDLASLSPKLTTPRRTQPEAAVSPSCEMMRLTPRKMTTHTQ